jgi:hypothetical protein
MDEDGFGRVGFSGISYIFLFFMHIRITYLLRFESR